MESESDEAAQKSRKVRYFRKKATVLKAKKMLGFFTDLKPLDWIKSPQLNQLLQDYLECLAIEETPEKGERRISDDFIFVIEEIFREGVIGDPQTIPNGVKLFRIGLLEFCLSQSIYNFDIALQLNKLYQELNLNNLFVDKQKYFQFKGIQLEALGYVAIRQYIYNNIFPSLNYWYNKYFTFHKRNSADIQKLKAKAMQKQNYEKVDEFYQYQDHLDKSYFKQLVIYLKHTFQLKEKMSNDTWIKEFCTGLASKEYEYIDDKFLEFDDESLSKHFARTQDLGVWT